MACARAISPRRSPELRQVQRKKINSGLIFLHVFHEKINLWFIFLYKLGKNINLWFTFSLESCKKINLGFIFMRKKTLILCPAG